MIGEQLDSIPSSLQGNSVDRRQLGKVCIQSASCHRHQKEIRCRTKKSRLGPEALGHKVLVRKLVCI